MRNSSRNNPFRRYNNTSLVSCAAAFCLIFLPGVGASLCASNLSIEREARIQYDLGGVRMAQWSGGALLTFVSNQTAAPAILSFDDQGRQQFPVVLAIPGSEVVDLNDVARGPDGAIIACGSAYDHSGRGSGFIAISDLNGDRAAIISSSPYVPFRVAAAGDGTIWTAGLEMTNAMDSTPPGTGVIRRYDRTGRMLQALIPRSAFSSSFMVQYGILRSDDGRIGWYTGPMNGPGSQYYEIFSDGRIRKYPPVSPGKWEGVTGLALINDGRTYISTADLTNHTYRLLSTSGPDKAWVGEALPAQLRRLWLFGGDGRRLVVQHRDRFTMAFIKVGN